MTPVILTTPGDYVVFSQQKALFYVNKLTGWLEDITGGGVYKKDFRWGTSNRVRASWEELTQEKLDKVILDPNHDLYVDFRITFINGPAITINNIEILYEQDSLAKDPYLGFFPVYTVSDKGNISNLTKIENFTFRPYQVNSLVVLYKELSFSINQLFGVDVLYGRAVPMSIGKDFVLNEWTLYDVDEPKCLKAIIPNNEFPDSKITFNPMGIDFEMPFEVHIVKNYFEDIFGIGTAPQKRDILYMPMENRVYEVESSYLYKDLMRTEIYWKVNLIKYQPKANRKEPTLLKQNLQELTTSYQEEFQTDLDLQEIQITKPQQYDPKIGSRDYDPTRLIISDELLITQNHVRNWSLLISESQYDLRSIFRGGIQKEAVVYRANVDLPADSERSFSCWFKEMDPPYTVYKDNLKGGISLGSLSQRNYNLTFKISARRNYAEGDYLKITKFNGFSVYGQLVSFSQVAGGYNYIISVNQEIIEFLNTYYPNWASLSASGYIAEKIHENVIFNGYDKEIQKGFSISLFASRYLIIKRNDKEFLYILKNDLVKDYWYALFINMSNFYRQLTVDLWVRKWNETMNEPQQTTDLENIYTFTQNIIPEDLTIDKNYNLFSNNLILTNIRLYDKIETDQIKQINMINQTIVTDSQYSIIIDNAIPRLRLPFIGQTK